MKKLVVSAVLASFLGSGLWLGAGLSAAPFNIDTAHSSVNFKIGHMVVSSVDGTFNKFNGSVDIDSTGLKSLEGQIDMASVNTRNDKRDTHLKASEFLDSSKHPKATLKSSKITNDNGNVKVEADLTLRGVSKKVTLVGTLKGPGKNPRTNKDIYGLTLQTQINRKDFNIGKDTSSASMGDDVEINISLELNAK